MPYVDKRYVQFPLTRGDLQVVYNACGEYADRLAEDLPDDPSHPAVRRVEEVERLCDRMRAFFREERHGETGSLDG